MSLSVVNSDEEIEENERLQNLPRKRPSKVRKRFCVDTTLVDLAQLRCHVNNLAQREGRSLVVYTTDRKSKSFQYSSPVLILSAIGLLSLDREKEEQETDTVQWTLGIRGVWHDGLFTLQGCPSVFLSKAKTGHRASLFSRKVCTAAMNSGNLTIQWSTLKPPHSPVYTKEQIVDYIANYWSHSSHVYFSRLRNKMYSVVKMTDMAEFQCVHCHKTFDTFRKWHDHFSTKLPTQMQWYHLLFRDRVAFGKPVTLNLDFKAPKKISCLRRRRREYLASKSPSPDFFSAVREKLVLVAHKSPESRRPILNPEKYYETDRTWMAVS